MADAVRLALRRALRGVHRLTPEARAMVVAFGDAVAGALHVCGADDADDVYDMFKAMMHTQTREPLVLDRLVRLVLLGRLGMVPLREALVVTGAAVPALLHTAAKCLWASVRLVFQCYAPPKLPVALLDQVHTLMEGCLHGKDKDDAVALHACVGLHSVLLHCVQHLPLAPKDGRADMFLGGLADIVRVVYSTVPLSEVLHAYADVDRLAATWAALGPELEAPADLRRHLCSLMVQLRP